MKYIRFLPLIIFLLLIIFFAIGLMLNPHLLPSTFINKKVPEFNVVELTSGHQLSKEIFFGKVTLMNVWATWCESCVLEHPLLMRLAKQEHVRIIGLDYKDNREKALTWLKKYGNPYQLVGFDTAGNTAIDWGVYGTPETFIIDKRGVIRYKHVGALDENTIQTKVLPLVRELGHEN